MRRLCRWPAREADAGPAAQQIAAPRRRWQTMRSAFAIDAAPWSTSGASARETVRRYARDADCGPAASARGAREAARAPYGSSTKRERDGMGTTEAAT